jgi:hypothetical protein
MREGRGCKSGRRRKSGRSCSEKESEKEREKKKKKAEKKKTYLVLTRSRGASKSAAIPEAATAIPKEAMGHELSATFQPPIKTPATASCEAEPATAASGKSNNADNKLRVQPSVALSRIL